MRTLVKRAAQRVGADIGAVWRYIEVSDDRILTWRYHFSHVDLDRRSGAYELNRARGRAASAFDLMAVERRPVQICGTVEAILEAYPNTPFERHGVPRVPQARLFVPLLREGELVGFFVFYSCAQSPSASSRLVSPKPSRTRR